MTAYAIAHRATSVTVGPSGPVYDGPSGLRGHLGPGPQGDPGSVYPGRTVAARRPGWTVEFRDPPPVTAAQAATARAAIEWACAAAVAR